MTSGIKKLFSSKSSQSRESAAERFRQFSNVAKSLSVIDPKGDRGFQANRTVRKCCTITSDTISRVVDETAANAEQKEFLGTFCGKIVEEVFDPSQSFITVAQSIKIDRSSQNATKAGSGQYIDKVKELEEFDPRHLLILSTDMQRLELRMSPKNKPFDDVILMVKRFLRECGMPDPDVNNRLQNMTWAKDCCSVEDSAQGPEYTEVELWCILDHMGDEAKASADAGFTLWWTKVSNPLKWCAVDMLLPASKDKERFLEFANSEKPPLLPTCYTCSFLLPVAESIRGLQIELPRSPQAAFLGLMMFKEMGFVKPDDRVFKQLLDLEQRGAYVGLLFGPEGLTRMFCRFFRTEIEKDIELAALLRFEYKRETVANVCLSVGADFPEIIEYAAEQRGFTVSVGFTG